MPATTSATDSLQGVIAAICLASEERRRQNAEALTLASKRIRQAVLKQFESEERPLFHKLRCALGGGGVPLAALSVCGKGTEEVRFTKLIAYFMSPDKPHGLGGRLLRAVLEDWLGDDVRHASWNRAVVFSEYDLGMIDGKGCVIDIVVRLPELDVFVEEKVDSGESHHGGKSQLRRYSEAIAAKTGLNANRYYVYLTPDRRNPSERDRKEWSPQSHGDLISAAARVLDDGEVGTVARHNLACLLWDLLMGPLSIDERSMETLRRMIDASRSDAKARPRLQTACKERRLRPSGSSQRSDRRGR